MKLSAGIFAAVLGAATSAGAVSYNIEAVDPSDGFTLYMTYDDVDGDGLIGDGELTDFSSSNPIISALLELVGIASWGGVADGTNGPSWLLEDPTNSNNWAAFFAGDFVYTQYKVNDPTDSTNPVPLPASGLLLAGGIAGAAIARRRKQK